MEYLNIFIINVKMFALSFRIFFWGKFKWLRGNSSAGDFEFGFYIMVLM